MRIALGLRWERAVALVAAILIMMVVALTVVGAVPAQAAEEAADDVTVVLVVEQSDEGDTPYTFGGGSFDSFGGLLSTWGNSWG